MIKQVGKQYIVYDSKGYVVIITVERKLAISIEANMKEREG